MLSIALATLRARRGGFAGAFVALFCAAALVTGCGVLLNTGLRGQVSPQRYAGAPLLVAADQQLHFVEHKHDKAKTKSKPATEMVHLPMAEVTRVRAVAGVSTAVPDVTFPATVIRGPSGDVSQENGSWGHGWGSARLTPFTLARGRAPAAADEVVLDAAAHARLGERVVIQMPASTASYTVVGITAQALSGQPAIFFADATADRLAENRLTAIGVWPAAGVDRAALVRRLERIGDGVKVYVGAAKGTVEFAGAARARESLVSMSAVLGGTALLVAILVVVGTFALSMEQRHREIALLRAAGATPRQIRRMLTQEALVLSVVAAGLGSIAGLPLADWLHRRFVAFGTIPERLHLVTGPVPPMAAALATVAAAVLAARVAARRPTRVGAAAALAAAAAPRRSALVTVAGLALLAAGVAAIVLLRALHTEPAAMPVSMLAVVAPAAGLMLLGPVVGHVAAAATAVPLRLLARTTGYLAAENIHANTRRFAAVAAPMTLAVAIAVTVLFTGTTLASAAQNEVRDGTIAAYALGSTGAGVPADVAAAAAQTPGVIAVTQVLHSTVWIGENRYAAQGVTPTGLNATMDLGVTQGSIRDLSEKTVALSTTTASGLGMHIGDTLALRLGDGTPARLRVVAIYARGLGFGALTLPYQLLAAHVDVPMAATVLVAGPASAEPALQALAATHPGIHLVDSAALLSQQAAPGDDAVRYIFLALVVGFAAISVVNTLAIATLDRRRELALLYAVGATRRQTLRMLRAETLAATAMGLLLGATIGGGALACFAAGMTGTPRPAVSGPVCAAIVAATCLLAYLGAAVPARLMLRTLRLPN